MTTDDSTLSKIMKNHMDAVRGVTGASGLLNMAMATDGLNNLERVKISLNEMYTGSLDNIDHSSILFVTGEGNSGASVRDQKTPFDGAWWIVLSLVSTNGGGRIWQFAMPDSQNMIFERIQQTGTWYGWSKLGGGK